MFIWCGCVLLPVELVLFLLLGFFLIVYLRVGFFALLENVGEVSCLCGGWWLLFVVVCGGRRVIYAVAFAGVVWLGVAGVHGVLPHCCGCGVGGLGFLLVEACFCVLYAQCPVYTVAAVHGGCCAHCTRCLLLIKKVVYGVIIE